ncbi:hypothetical protein EG329_000783 [Mollisiaceae sp. DMI_Dod_QoI]|nr:hypothetical protein EG329_000783 [Helotiales sp. DMI_Dod_QoI]
MACAHTPCLDGSSNTLVEPTFPRFRELPIELRQAIWRMAMPYRIIHIYERPVKVPKPNKLSTKAPFSEGQRSQEQRRQGWPMVEQAVWPRQCQRDGKLGYWKPMLAPFQHLQEEDLSLEQKGRSGDDADQRHFLQAPMRDPRRDSRRWGIDTDSKIPAIILACREAFQVCNYVRSFAGIETFAQTYFNPDFDILFLSEESAVSLSRENDRTWDKAYDRMNRLIQQLDSTGQLGSVRYLGLTIAGISTWSWLEEWLATVLGSFGNIETLYLVIDDWPMGNGKPWVSRHRAGMCMTTPVNANRALEAFTSPLPDLADWYQLGSSMPSSGIDMARLEVIRLERIETGARPWKLPSIETKHIVYKDMKIKLARAEREYKQKIAQGKISKA